MVDPLSFDFLIGVLVGALALAPISYYGFRWVRRWVARRRAGLRQTAQARIVSGRRRRRSAPTSPVVAHAVENAETRLAVTWAEFRRRHL
jgi:hypothetical protein